VSEDSAVDQIKAENKSTARTELIVDGEVRVKASMSMLFSDILSQELSAALGAPESIGVLQKHLRDKPLEQLNPSELKPFIDNVPDNVVDVIKEAVFCSGAAIKRIHCEYPIRVGEGFIFRASGLMADLELLDGRVVAIRPLTKR
jgi:hypothetical protein